MSFFKGNNTITPWINVVTDHNANNNYPTNGASAVTAINAAIDAAIAAGGRSVIFIPPGKYLIDAALNNITASGIKFMGAGKDQTTFVCTGNSDVLSFGYRSDGNNIGDSGVQGIRFECGTKADGFIIKSRGVDYFAILDVFIQDPFNGILTDSPNFQLLLRDITIKTVRGNYGWWMKGRGRDQIISPWVSVQHCQIIKFYNMEIEGANTGAPSSLLLCAEGANYSLYADTVRLISGGTGLVLRRNTEGTPSGYGEFFHATNMFIANSYNMGANVSAHNDVELTNLTVANTVAGPGMSFGADSNNIRIVNGSIYDNFSEGIIFSGKTMTLAASDVYRNSRRGANSNSGILILSGADGFSMVGSSSGNNASRSGSETQQYGIRVNAGSRIGVVGSRLNGNATGPTLGTLTANAGNIFS